jgi:hypothetical protein
MNLENINRASGAAIAFLIASLLFVVLSLAVKLAVTVPAIDVDRDGQRSQALAEIRQTESAALDQAGWVDPARGLVRLPIVIAMQQAAQAWQNPAAARADLIARQEKASAPAPVAPPKPSAFE